MPSNKQDDALRYINSLRNPEKRDYATRYAIWLARSPEDRETIVPPVSFHLSYMNAQSVRMRLTAILADEQGATLLPVLAVLTAFTVTAVLIAQSGLLSAVLARLAEVH